MENTSVLAAKYGRKNSLHILDGYITCHCILLHVRHIKNILKLNCTS